MITVTIKMMTEVTRVNRFGGIVTSRKQKQMIDKVMAQEAPVIKKNGIIGYMVNKVWWDQFSLQHPDLVDARKRKKKEKKRKAKILNKMSVGRDDWSWKPNKHQDIPVIKLAGKLKSDKGTARRKRSKLSKKDNDEFYSSREWRELRVRVLEKYECKCMMCGRSPKLHGIVIHVDHIKPRSKYPELALTFENLQILCDDCNLGKSNKFSTDWRPEMKIVLEAMKHI